MLRAFICSRLVSLATVHLTRSRRRSYSFPLLHRPRKSLSLVSSTWSAVLRGCTAVPRREKSVESDNLSEPLTQFKDKGSRGPVNQPKAAAWQRISQAGAQTQLKIEYFFEKGDRMCSAWQKMQRLQGVDLCFFLLWLRNGSTGSYGALNAIMLCKR